MPGERAVRACCDVVNRGVAYWDGRVFVGTLDGRLIALEAHTGKPIWSIVTVDQSKPYTITGAPRVIHGKVVIGNGGAELGVRGYISAYDVADGKLAWRFYTVPGQPGHKDGAASDDIMERLASKSWTGQWWTESGGGGGGTVWDSMAYDPQLNLLYIGVGNASYWNAKYRSPGGGDNLFVSSIVALKPDTGEYVWHYQQVPGDEWDYTATQHIILSDLRIGGAMRKVLMQAPKNGFFYVIDRTNGELISAEPFSQLNWASHVDLKTGRPVVNPEARYSKTGKPWLGRPGPYGAHSWQPMAYSPQTGLVYIPVQDVPAVYASDDRFKRMEKGYNLGIADVSKLEDAVPSLQQVRDATKGTLVAWNPVTQRPAWRVQHDSFSNGGLLATAGSLVFQGGGEGTFDAYDAGTGNRLWTYDAQDAILAAPVTFAVKGRQYVTVLVGWGGAGAMSGGPYVWGSKGVRQNRSRVLTFALGATGRLPTIRKESATPQTAPPKPFGDAAMIRTGEWAYGRTCVVCHSSGAVGGGGAPDLRHSSIIGDEAAWKSVVADGALAANGMVGFRENFSPEQIEAIRAYVVARANSTRGK